MRLSNHFLKKLFLGCLLSVLLLSPCFSEKSSTITESELTEILTQTDRMMMKVDELTESVKKLESQRNEYMTLSNELKRENEELQAKVKAYRLVTIGVCSGALVGGLTYYILNR